ncbi:YqjF family protein [Prosthecobacter fluviatilis]|uniref:YqjF family protein n=1 Tax=Prosthecobacter fluviatilis TaxID=445931 RepID=A0ABW0KVC0_9BACT
MPAAPTLESRLAFRERPTRAHVMSQRWESLLFLHWRWDAAEIQSTLPPGLFVDTFQGDAWLAIVPFYMCGIRPRFCPPVRGISDFLELNVRTYVHDEQGRPGVWFYSLDCNQRLAVWTARTFFHLPYQNARMSAQVRDGCIDYRCQRGGEPAASHFRYRIAAESQIAEPGSLAFFLAERYLLFAQTPRGIRCGQVHHTPYALAEASLEAWDAKPLLQAGFTDPRRPPDHIIGSSGVDVAVYPLTS